MKIYVTQLSRNNAIGGGWTFNRNLRQALQDRVEFVNKIEEADIFLISGLTQTSKEEIRYVKEHNIPTIFRIDEIPKRSRNRKIDIRKRLVDYAKLASKIVYQSQWSKEYVGNWCGDGVVIYNGVDTDIFKPDGVKYPRPKDYTIYLSVMY